MEGLGKRIQKYREKAGMTQEVLAEQVGVSWNHLGAIERGVKTPKLETLVRIINVLEVSADDVMLDVLRVGRKAQCTRIEEKLQRLPKEKQDKILRILDFLIEEEEK
ncbi:helix-turn-helix domain-containing protein [Sporofaciens musculi]|uniref:helix-turn-helix domain-containing protein n=1 Tax=Sporofaciens musculi TaxID=2681861 RepID=UPI0025711AD7|nr:helix-turn-helix transcriptional regulator [Sporofaciens musculi]